MSPGELDLDPEEASAWLEEDPGVRLLDVREPVEWRTARIEGARLATPDLALEVLSTWPRETPILVYCHHGIRSRFFALRLLHAGFKNVRNLRGGIEKWSLRVDPTVPRYEIRYGSEIAAHR
jgi:rhodanese-related sulfurtransferase